MTADRTALGIALAFKNAPPQFIVAFDFGHLVSAAFWGHVLFAETPDALSNCCLSLIKAADLLLVLRKA